ncbi:MAG: sodium-dependent transporter [Planctomycetota bacterium]|jgi:NSS family neurotransmitter:Na+ symporter
MAELLEEQRESWGTRGGFILAAVGSAVGLGNLWGFPYKLYSYGGGAFLIPYIVALFVIGVPIMILEFSIGHYTQRAAPDAFKRGHKRFEVVGWWGIMLAFVIITYYPVILAYCFSFLWYSIVGIINGGELPWAGKGIEGVENAKLFFNETYLGRIDIAEARFKLGSIRWNLVLPLAITWITMYLCIFKGVRLVGKIVWLTVPLPWLMLAILTVRGLTLEGSMQGLAYYLDPVWSELAKPVTWRYAIGQVFFSLSLAYGIMITYASFLHRRSDINNNAAIISVADFATSFVAGLAVFATLGGMAFVTQQGDNPVAVGQVAETGPSLAFVAFPYALAQLPYSAWFSFIFFFALVTLGVDSAFSMTESILASIIDKTGWRRCIALPVLSVVGFLFGLFYITRAGFNWLGAIDGFVNGTWGIAFMGLLECVVLGWLWRIGTLRRHANSRSDWQLGKWWDYLIRLVIPVVLGTLFFWQLFDDLTGEGFLKTPEGDWILTNCVGLSIVAMVPVVAIILSLVRGRRDIEEPTPLDKGLPVRGRAQGALAFLAAVTVAGLLIAWLTVPMTPLAKKIVIWQSLIVGITAMLLANHVLDRYFTAATQATWFARWAGIIAAMDASAAIAILLIGWTQDTKVVEAAMPIRDKLSGVSYIILAVVSLIILGGLSWCFYRALVAVNHEDIQHPEEQ